MVDDTYRWFVDLVASRRSLSPVDALQLSDGRVYTGRQAASLRLIDGVGGMTEARQWLQDERGVDRDVPVRRVDGPLVPLGLDFLALARKTLLSETLRVDGLVSLWQPEALR